MACLCKVSILSRTFICKYVPHLSFLLNSFDSFICKFTIITKICFSEGWKVPEYCLWSLNTHTVSKALINQSINVLSKVTKKKGTTCDEKASMIFLDIILKNIEISDDDNSKRSIMLKALVDHSIFQFFHLTARDYIKQNRPVTDLNLFDKLYTDNIPYYCSMVMYNGDSAGIDVHKDHAPFCSLILCFQGNDAILQLTSECNENVDFVLKDNDCITFARINHSVPPYKSLEKRVVCIATF